MRARVEKVDVLGWNKSTDVVTGREIVGELTLLKMMYAVIKPQLAVDHRTTEMRMEASVHQLSPFL